MNRRNFIITGASLTALSLPGCASKSMDSVRYASPSLVWWNAVPFFARELGLYKKYGITVNDFEVATGTKSKKAVADGNSETGVAAPNSISLATPDELKQLRIIANTMQSDATVSIVMREPVTDWSKQTVAIVKGTIAEFYLIAYLEKIGQLDAYTSDEINFISTSPTGVANAFNNKSASVGAVWEPVASLLSKQVNSADLIIRDPELYNQQIYLLSTSDFMANNRQQVEAMSNAFKDSCAYITQNRDAAAGRLEKASGFESGFLINSDAWKRTSFPFSTSKEDILPVLRRDWEIANIAKITQSNLDEIEQAVEFL